MRASSSLNSRSKKRFIRMNGKSRHEVYSKNLDENDGKTKRPAAGVKTFSPEAVS